MAKAEPKTTQGSPTENWPVDDTGRALDAHGLPINGPARLERLEELGIEDPALTEPAATPSPAEAPAVEPESGSTLQETAPDNAQPQAQE